MAHIVEATSTNYGVIDGFSTALNNLCYTLDRENYNKTISMISKETFIDNLEDPSISYYIIYENSDDGRIIIPCGYIKARICRGYNGSHSVVIEEMYISKAYRLMGMGKALINKVYEWGRSRDIRSVEVTIPTCMIEAFGYFSYLGFFKSAIRLRKGLV